MKRQEVGEILPIYFEYIIRMTAVLLASTTFIYD
jgi:hypothetical protein